MENPAQLTRRIVRQEIFYSDEGFEIAIETEFADGEIVRTGNWPTKTQHE